jgi:hypothetical protein
VNYEAIHMGDPLTAPVPAVPAVSPGDAAAGALGGPDAPDPGNLDKVRDILFGTQSRELERRIARLEERVAKDAADLRDEFRRRLDALEQYTRREFEATADRISSEQADRSKAFDALSGDLRSMAGSLERQIAQSDEQSARAQRELRQQLLDQAKQLTDEIRRVSESLTARQDEAVRELRHEKTDREALADMLAEVAMRLKNEFKLPTAE